MMKTALLALAVALPCVTTARDGETRPVNDCTKAHRAVVDAFGNAYFGPGDKKEKGKLPGLVKTCQDKCPQPYYADCAMFNQSVEYDDIEEGCRKPYSEMHVAYDSLFDGDKKAAKTFPDVVKKCVDACKGDKRIHDECVAFEGIDENTDFEGTLAAGSAEFDEYVAQSPMTDVSDECEAARDKLMTTEGMFLKNMKKPSAKELKNLNKLVDACTNLCPGSCGLIVTNMPM